MRCVRGVCAGDVKAVVVCECGLGVTVHRMVLCVLGCVCCVCVCVCGVCVCDARLQPHPPSDGLGAGDAVPVIVHEHGVSDDGSDAELEHRGGPAGLPGCVLGHCVVSAVVGVYVTTCIASMCVWERAGMWIAGLWVRCDCV